MNQRYCFPYLAVILILGCAIAGCDLDDPTEGVKTEDEMYMRDEYGTEELVMVESVTDEGVPGRYQDYKVRKNDTLQKISYKFYGTTRKWMKIFEANKDKLKTPDKIFPGMTIRIPVE